MCIQGSVTDRLITQQGLSSRARSSGTALRGPGKRLVLDKRYYEGLLQMKIQELTNEIASLRKETEINNKEREDFMVYDRQNKERAKELIGSVIFVSCPRRFKNANCDDSNNVC